MNQKVAQKMAGSMALAMLVTVLGTGSVFAQNVTYPNTTSGTGTTTLVSTTSAATPATTNATGTLATTTSGTGSSIPGVPNTGAGTDMFMNMLVLLASGSIAVGAAAYLALQQRKTR